MLSAVCLRARDQGWQEVEDLDEISDLIAGKTSLVWAQADIADVTPADMDTIARELGLHALAIEDAMSTRQRPKLESYDMHLFAVMHQLDEIDGQLEASQLACFIGDGYVLTLHHGAERTVVETMKRLRSSRKDDAQTTSFIMHALLDAIVDDYEATADRLESELESLEERALTDPRTALQGELYSIKQRLSRLRRYTVPGERVLAALLDTAALRLNERTTAYFRDVHDHTLRIIDQIRNIDDLTNAVIDLQRAEQANALNEVTKRLTGWAAIIAVPTFIASVYGMNFELIPNEGGLTGFVFALSLMVVAGVGLYVYFRRRNWI